MRDLNPSQLHAAKTLVSGPRLTPLSLREIGNHLVRAGMHHVFETVPRSGLEPTHEANVPGLRLIQAGLDLLSGSELPEYESQELAAIRATLDTVSSELGKLRDTLASAESLLGRISRPDVRRI